MGQLKGISPLLRSYCRHGPLWLICNLPDDAFGRRLLRMRRMASVVHDLMLAAWERRLANDPTRPLPTKFLHARGGGPYHSPHVRRFLSTPAADAASVIHDELFQWLERRRTWDN